MTHPIRWTLTAQIPGGERISSSKPVNIDAYEEVEVTIADGASEEDVEVQPGGAGQVQFMLISSNT